LRRNAALMRSEAGPRILIVAADVLSRAGLAAVLTSANANVVAQSDPAGDLVEAVRVFRPDVILWDLGWATDEELERIERIRAGSFPGTPVTVLLPTAEHAPSAWRAGFTAILLRSNSPDQLVAALHAHAWGLAVLDASLTTALPASPTDDAALPIEPLSPREREVLQLLAQGLPNKAIARRLEISEHTVKFHVNAILSKLGAQSRTDAVVRASRAGLVLL